jgi:glycosyltransferase involved in cell wall biosynthesis
LRRAFDALKAQTLPLLGWELLVIDNASRQKLSDTWDLSWHPNARHVREDELGLTSARLRGITEARGELLVFIDDDNVLARNFLEQVQVTVGCHPHLGVFGAGILEPEFEISPPPELRPFLGLLALRSVPSALWSNNPADVALIPWGAGMSMTREVAESYLQLIQRLNVKAIIGRRGPRLYSAEDDLFSWASAITGQGFGLFPNLRVTHLISAHRLNQPYFLRLIEDHQFSHAILQYLMTGVQSSNAQRSMNLLRNLRILLHGVRNGQFSMRYRWAGIRGRDQAARFISENRLRPLENYLPEAAVDNARRDLTRRPGWLSELSRPSSVFLALTWLQRCVDGS